MKKYTLALIIVATSAGMVRAEFGVNFMIGYGYEADIGIDSGFYGNSNPGDAVAGVDHTYDDGFNRVDSSGNFDGVTTYWGYQDSSQYDSSAQTLSMTSLLINAGDGQSSTVGQDGGQPGLEFWWKQALLHGDRKEGQPAGGGDKSWSIDVRAALRWQRLEIDAARDINASLELLTDTYDTGGISVPTAPFSGTFAGPNAAIGDAPTRTMISLPGTVSAEYEVEASVFALDFGPAFTLPIGDHVQFICSGGLSLAYCRSEFDYTYNDLYRVSENENDTLVGGYLSIDALFGENVSLGIATYQLQDLELNNGGNYAQIDFSKSFTIRLGLAF